MTDYKLTKNVAEFFEFEIGEYKYKMRYPNGKERMKMADIATQIQSLAGKSLDSGGANSDDVQKKADEMNDLINSFITSDDKDAPSIDKLLEEQTTPVLRNFQNMIQTELSLEVPNQVSRGG